MEKVGIVLERHDDASKESGNLGDRALIPIAISYKPKINSKTVQGGRTGSGVQQEVGTFKGSTVIIKETQWLGGSVQARNGAAVLAMRLVQVEVPA